MVVVTVAGMIPRLDCLGLIEAGALVAHATVSEEIPRLDCLGLIEATLCVYH